ncbi:MAG: hypothetical protein UU34_C0010G0018 [Candidatus Curtissbacteria bacterium GW2011_GWA1_41_11]|uniref:S23 ribosomal protein n=1 Tax=Candidatus Curtissbacteria bacterium GW2011_GWA1_41_11 TaxID=1618409 RepID=A0A0G0WQM5_9BACT|nr:MAG: hypothetical protein UU34_C0010G0018 [Candidatus Curtissbacteria bacterium GW2011_GWA1_41_11]
MYEAGYKKLIVYQKSKELALLVYSLTKEFPKEEIYGITSQMRRAATSIVANIVEGYVKGSTKEYIRFLDISIGSTAELDAFGQIVKELNYLDERNYQRFENLRVEVAKLLFAYRKSLRLKLNP